MSRKKAAPNQRQIRQRLELAIQSLIRQHKEIAGECRLVEQKLRNLEQEYVSKLLELLMLDRLLEETYEDAEWVRRKATIRSRSRDLLSRRLLPTKAQLTDSRLPPAIIRELHDLVNRIQEQNQYAHVSGDFSIKADLQNLLLESYAHLVDVSWDGERCILIEYQGRSAGHLPIADLSPIARRTVGPRLGLSVL
ncbi:MAG: hypothetical protein HY692_02225 [Cyanobacteria bacterium NC_groundwater_1444_Ag_S-0.65um_54_12]|nr:hypothetical protein [Cyanobacteria bacterium NC_groundwater_1444_Ag_S-0.65um_54_12]